MEITVIFHYANPLIGVHLSLQVAGFFRFIASILLLVIVIFEVRAQYLADAWICKKGISFGKRIIAFFSFYIIPTLYVFVGKGTCASFFQCLPRATFCPTPGSIPFIHACWLFQRLLYVIAYQATFFFNTNICSSIRCSNFTRREGPTAAPGERDRVTFSLVSVPLLWCVSLSHFSPWLMQSLGRAFQRTRSWHAG